MADEEKKISQNKQKKVDLVKEYEERVEKSQGLVFADYQGLTHQQLESLKRAVKKIDGEFIITKNTLILRALSSKKLSDDDKNHFNRPTATLFMYGDVINPLKELAKVIKELNLPSIKFGIIEGRSVAADDVVKLSTLPPVEVLRAQLLGQMLSPVQGLHRALNWNLQNLVMTIKAIADKKPAVAASASVSSAPAEEPAATPDAPATDSEEPATESAATASTESPEEQAEPEDQTVTEKEEVKE